MHTSSSTYANAGLPMGRAVPQRSLPPCGGGTGRGVQQATARVSDPRLNHRTLDISNLHRICFAPCALSPPLSLSLPHMGGGNAVARTFATHDQRNSRRGHAQLGSEDQLLAEFWPWIPA